MYPLCSILLLLFSSPWLASFLFLCVCQDYSPDSGNCSLFLFCLECASPHISLSPYISFSFSSGFKVCPKECLSSPSLPKVLYLHDCNFSLSCFFFFFCRKHQYPIHYIFCFLIDEACFIHSWSLHGKQRLPYSKSLKNHLLNKE